MFYLKTGVAVVNSCPDLSQGLQSLQKVPKPNSLTIRSLLVGPLTDVPVKVLLDQQLSQVGPVVIIVL